jgi:hypothetical protein
MDHATRQRRLNAAQSRYDAMLPDDDDCDDAPDCLVCGDAMIVVDEISHEDGVELVYACPRVDMCWHCEQPVHDSPESECSDPACIEAREAEEAEALAALDAEAMDGDHETALASVYGGEE